MRAMPDLSWTHAYIKYVHVLGVLIFLIGHGVSIMALWRIRTERDPHVLRTLLDFSARSIGVMSIGGLIWLLSGIYLGFSGNYWTTGTYWIWAALVVAIVVIGVMTPMGRLYLNRVRVALGVDPRATSAAPPPETVDAAALEAAIASGRPVLLMAIGLVGLAVLAWLMMFKPF
jgi:hypothetical protein